MNKKYERIYISLLIAFGFLLFYWWSSLIGAEFAEERFEVIFLDVGQGDSILVQTPNNKNILIDGGRGSNILNQISKFISQNNKTIDVVIATHADADHIGGLISIFERYDVREFIYALPEADTNVYSNLKESVANEESIIHRVDGGGSFIYDEVEFFILSPTMMQSDRNDSSIVLLVRYEDAEVLLTGDASFRVEKNIIENFSELVKHTDILKAGHHGSHTSSSYNFISSVLPKYFVLSYGANNSYGHPSESVIDNAEAFNVEVLETTRGNVVFSSNGGDFNFEGYTE